MKRVGNRVQRTVTISPEADELLRSESQRVGISMSLLFEMAIEAFLPIPDNKEIGLMLVDKNRFQLARITQND